MKLGPLSSYVTNRLKGWAAMYFPQFLDQLLARTEAAVVASVKTVLYSAGTPVGPPIGADGQPGALPPGIPMPVQPDQILDLTILDVLAGALPDGPITAYKISERYFLTDSDGAERWLLFLHLEESGRWRIFAAYAPDDVDAMRAQLQAYAAAPAPLDGEPDGGGLRVRLRRTLGLDGPDDAGCGGMRS